MTGHRLRRLLAGTALITALGGLGAGPASAAEQSCRGVGSLRDGAPVVSMDEFDADPTRWSDVRVQVSGHLSNRSWAEAGVGLLCSEGEARREPGGSSGRNCVTINLPLADSKSRFSRRQVIRRLLGRRVVTEGVFLPAEKQPNTIATDFGHTLGSLTEVTALLSLESDSAALCVSEQRNLLVRERFASCRIRSRSGAEELCLDPLGPVVWLRTASGDVRSVAFSLPPGRRLREVEDLVLHPRGELVLHIGGDVFAEVEGNLVKRNERPIARLVQDVDGQVFVLNRIDEAATEILCPAMELGNDFELRCSQEATDFLICPDQVATSAPWTTACLRWWKREVWLSDDGSHWRRVTYGPLAGDKPLVIRDGYVESASRFYLATEKGLFLVEQGKGRLVDEASVEAFRVVGGRTFYLTSTCEVREVVGDAWASAAADFEDLRQEAEACRKSRNLRED